MSRHFRRLITGACVGLAITLSGANGAAYADATTVQGSRTCATGQVVYVRASVERAAQMKFYNGTLVVYTSPTATDHVYKYSSRSVKWKIYSTGNILTQRDGCMTAGGTLLND
jgi:hypothetical protein